MVVPCPGRKPRSDMKLSSSSCSSSWKSDHISKSKHPHYVSSREELISRELGSSSSSSIATKSHPTTSTSEGRSKYPTDKTHAIPAIHKLSAFINSNGPT